MTGPSIAIEWIKWHERTMTLYGESESLGDGGMATFTVAYAHISSAAMFKSYKCTQLNVVAGGLCFEMRFVCDANARDAAAELANRMEAAR